MRATPSLAVEISVPLKISNSTSLNGLSFSSLKRIHYCLQMRTHQSTTAGIAFCQASPDPYCSFVQDDLQALLQVLSLHSLLSLFPSAGFTLFLTFTSQFIGMGFLVQKDDCKVSNSTSWLTANNIFWNWIENHW